MRRSVIRTLDKRDRRRDYPDRKVWDLTDYEVNYLHLDWRFGFDCSGTRGRDGYLRVTINVPFTLETPSGPAVCDPEDISSITGALHILHKDARAFTVHASGRLETEFTEGLRLWVDKHDRYESWEAQGEGELSEISMLCSPHPGPPWGELQ